MKNILIMCISGLLLLNVSGCFNKTNYDDTTNSVTSEQSSNEYISEETLNNEDSDTLEKEKKSSEFSDKKQESKSDAEEVKSINRKTIVIDPGHGEHSNLEKEKQSPDSSIMKIKDGGGAEGIVTGVPEYEVNMKVAMKLKNLLEKNNFNVIMTKTTHSESPGNIDRANVGNDCNADLEIRIHCDSSDNQSAMGASMLVPQNVGYVSAVSSISRQYGEVILNSLVDTCGMKNRGIILRSDMTGFNWSKVPVVLVEMGFMSNPSEDRMLSDDSYQDKLAQGLCNGIIEALN